MCEGIRSVKIILHFALYIVQSPAGRRGAGPYRLPATPYRYYVNHGVIWLRGLKYTSLSPRLVYITPLTELRHNFNSGELLSPIIKCCSLLRGLHNTISVISRFRDGRPVPYGCRECIYAFRDPGTDKYPLQQIIVLLWGRRLDAPVR